MFFKILRNTHYISKYIQNSNLIFIPNNYNILFYDQILIAIEKSNHIFIDTENNNYIKVVLPPILNTCNISYLHAFGRIALFFNILNYVYEKIINS